MTTPSIQVDVQLVDADTREPLSPIIEIDDATFSPVNGGVTFPAVRFPSLTDGPATVAIAMVAVPHGGRGLAISTVSGNVFALRKGDTLSLSAIDLTMRDIYASSF